MKLGFLSKVAIVFAVLAVGGLLASVPIRNSYAGKAQLIQIIESNEGDQLFGDNGTPVGSPQEIIIEDPKAFMGGKSPEGAKLVSQKYIKDNGIYPLQLKSVDAILKYSRYALIALLLGCQLTIWLGVRKAKKRASLA